MASINKIIKDGVEYGISTLETYSTDEQIIGTWIDNKPIYRKVITFQQDFSVNTWYDLKLNTSDIKDFTYVKGICKWSNSTVTKNVPSLHSSSDWNIFEGDINSDHISIRAAGAYTGSNAINSFTYVIEYTKTTD